jgi:hypothetical protein
MCESLISTIGFPETARLFAVDKNAYATFSDSFEKSSPGRLSFVESICLLDRKACSHLPIDRTIIFFNLNEKFSYQRPSEAVDINSGVICFPGNFQNLEQDETIQLRITHMANYDLWHKAYYDDDKTIYPDMKKNWATESKKVVGKIIGNYSENIVYEDSFTPVTIERYTSRMQGAVYGSPEKIKSGRTNFSNLFIAGTDQGYLGIIGSMLSGVTIVNQHILNKT